MKPEINQAQTCAAVLTKHGYNIVPINKGKKAPLIKGWQDKTFTADDIRAGIGIKCGVGDYPICAIDIDVTDENLSQQIADWCRDHLGYAPERVGRAPKTLLVYRAAEAGWRKVSSCKFGEAHHQVEVLGAGQQFVAYAVHPDTQKPYEWVDFFGGLEAMAANELPVITAEQITHVINVFGQMAADAGYEPVTSAAKDSLSKTQTANDDFTTDQPVGLSLDELKSYLEHIDPSDYDLWIKIGQALHHETGGDINGLNLWDDWSSTASNYIGYDDLEHRWQGFGRGDNPVTARTIIKLGNEANAKVEHELKKAIIAEYKEKISRSSDTVELEKIAKAIGKDLDNNDFATVAGVQSAIKEQWHAITGVKLNQTAINRLMNLKVNFGIDDLNKATERTEFGNAKRLVKAQQGKIMFVSETDMWYLWSGNFWRKGSATEIEQLAKDCVLDMVQDYQSLDSVGGDAMDFIKKSMEAKMIGNMVRLARSDAAVLTAFDRLDNNRMLLGVGNGAVDLTTGKLFDADPSDCITVATSVEYVAGAKCPVWEQTLNDIFANDAELINYMQKLVGYSVLANPIESLFVIMYGDGSNGKSTFINTIRDVLGNHAKVANSETFLGTAMNNSGSPREDILRLMGSRLVTITEPDEGGVLREGLVKAMTGGEALPARAAYGRTTVEVKPTWTAFMPTNHKPIIKGTDHGIWRRLILIPFVVNFDNHPTIKKDPERMAKLKAEYSGILVWIVQGALKYQQEGLQTPKVVEDARNEYKEDMDLLNDWITEYCVVGSGQAATSAQLWASWQQYAQANGELKYISSSRALGKRLSTRFTVIKNSHGIRGRGFAGISVNDNADFEDETEK